MPDSDNDKHRHNVGYIIGYHSIRQEWSKWANKQKLIDDEAIPLMNGLDPVSWMEYIDDEKGSFPIEMIHSIKRCLIIAKAEGFQIGTPAEWLVWGRNHDLNKPVLKSNEWLREPDTCMFYLFEIAVNAVSESSNALKPNQSNEQEVEWQVTAREKADLIYKKQKAIGCDPSKSRIADLIAEEFEKEGITFKRKRLNGGNIVRHALNTWNRPEK